MVAMRTPTAKAGRGASPMLFVDAMRLRHAKLFLPKFLEDEAFRAIHDDDTGFLKAKPILQQWADRADKGHLSQKETSLDSEFIQHIFGEALGYKSVIESPDALQRQKQFTVPGAGPADGAVGHSASGTEDKPLVLIELKGASTELDHDRSNGRTAVEQCWDYMNEFPDCPWGIVSNYVTIRLYHKSKPRRYYEEFTVKDFCDDAPLKQFYFLVRREGLPCNKIQKTRADELLKETAEAQRTVGDKLYDAYSSQRSALIAHLMDEHKKTQDQAIHIAQKILDRIIFVAFCEDRKL